MKFNRNVLLIFLAIVFGTISLIITYSFIIDTSAILNNNPFNANDFNKGKMQDDARDDDIASLDTREEIRADEKSSREEINSDLIKEKNADQNEKNKHIYEPKINQHDIKEIKKHKKVTSFVFYYLWYHNVTFNNNWAHWDHEILPDWRVERRDNFPHGIKYKTPEDFGASFSPLSLYSNSDPVYTKQSLQLIKDSNIDVVVISWWGIAGKIESRDGQNVSTDEKSDLVMRMADEVGIKIAFHLEPYENRTIYSVREDIIYIFSKYGKYESFYRDEVSGKPMFFCYDSYIIPTEDWRRLLSYDESKRAENKEFNFRNTMYDSDYISLILNKGQLDSISQSNFDGIYTYFSSEAFTEASTSTSWVSFAEAALLKNLSFIPCVGPGYNDERIRPWNSANTKKRENGLYYDNMFNNALKSFEHLAEKNVQRMFVAITSFNEWGEGSQIEPCKPYQSSTHKYEDYLPDDPFFYMNRTKEWLDKIENKLFIIQEKQK